MKLSDIVPTGGALYVAGYGHELRITSDTSQTGYTLTLRQAVNHPPIATTSGAQTVTNVSNFISNYMTSAGARYMITTIRRCQL
ncbi:hypothetical protein UFOVP451_49 [uncultured Caudovirales phage]|uniref:Uncharacterized protein n=1 Tax=uncultured Caudovirales phage TaxID=2100421 RepID=A0A6J5M6Y6_9CAUD|nr:hypothetical protein UFOVP451_49 [uncultured Caudovirales phage]